MRKFEVISEKQYQKDFNSNSNFKSIIIPTRNTINSAGYDFKAAFNFTLNPGEIKKIPTGIKCCMNTDEFLAIYIRSSIGFKYNVRLTNQTGIVDSDYYNNLDNEGHIWISFQNEGDKVWEINQGDKIAQGIFQKFYVVDDEENIDNTRSGGIGSTGK